MIHADQPSRSLDKRHQIPVRQNINLELDVELTTLNVLKYSVPSLNCWIFPSILENCKKMFFIRSL